MQFKSPTQAIATVLLCLSLPALHAQPAANAPRSAASAAQNTATQAITPAAPPAAGAPAQKLEQIEVRGANDTNQRRQSTATKIVISREELIKQGDTTIAEALKRLPGVTSGGPPGRGGGISMRGLGGGFTRILLNGEPIPRGFDLDSLSPEIVERIEVFRAATAEFSSQAVAGAINIVTRTPVSREVKEMTFGGSYENGQTSPQVGLRYSGATGSVSYTVNGQITGNRFVRPSTALELGRDAAGTVNVDRSAVRESRDFNNQVNLAPRVQWNLGKGENFAIEPFYFGQRVHNRYTDSNVTRMGTPAVFASSNSAYDFQLDVLRSAFQYNRPFGDGGRLESSFTLFKNQFDGSGYTLGLSPTNALLLDRRIDTHTTANGWSTKGKVTVPYLENHDASFGWDVSISKSAELRGRAETSFSPTIIPENLDEQFYAKNRQLAFYGQDEWKLGEKFSLYSGLRWEGVNIETETRGNPLLNPSFSNQSKVLSPSLQSLYKFGEKDSRQIRVALSRTYRAPNPFQLSPRKFVSANNTAVAPDSQGNPGLKPELAWGLDLGFEQYLPEGGLVGVNLFYRDIDDVFRNTIDFVNGRWVRQPINNGKARTVGIELETKFNLATLDKDLPKINFRTNLAVYRSVVDNIPGPNNRLEQQVPMAFNIGGDWTVPGMPLTVGGGLNVNTGGETRTAVNQVVYASVKRGLDMYAQWRFNPQSNLRVSLANMLAQDSISSNTVTDLTGGTDSQTTLIPTKPIVRAVWTQRF